mmetsp:Transcript_39910/g.109828  ORF Transcript_39910/g.109828 Transcript_39910/m.109828 type:complete len:255 (-) Transcript_39910:134-898(-)
MHLWTLRDVIAEPDRETALRIGVYQDLHLEVRNSTHRERVLRRDDLPAWMRGGEHVLVDLQGRTVHGVDPVLLDERPQLQALDEELHVLLLLLRDDRDRRVMPQTAVLQVLHHDREAFRVEVEQKAAILVSLEVGEKGVAEDPSEFAALDARQHAPRKREDLLDATADTVDLDDLFRLLGEESGQVFMELVQPVPFTIDLLLLARDPVVGLLSLEHDFGGGVDPLLLDLLPRVADVFLLGLDRSEQPPEGGLDK